MEKSKKDNNKSWGLVTGLIIALFITTALCGYFVGAYKFTNNLIKERREANSEVAKEEAVEETTEEESPFRTCVGTYKGKGTVSIDVQSKKETKGEYTLTLNEDGTYSFKSGYSESGVFVIKDNTLMLIHPKHTTGPRDEDTSHTAEVHLISSDCATIKIMSDTDETTVTLKKQ